LAYLSVRFWDDDALRRLNITERLLFACIVAGPRVQRLPGLCQIHPSFFNSAMRPCTKAETQAAFQGLLSAKVISWSEETELLRVHRTDNFYPTSNPNQVTSWRKKWAELPDDPLKLEHLTDLQHLAWKRKASRERYALLFSGIIIGQPATYPFVDPRERG
jgi:hypothetical protein